MLEFVTETCVLISTHIGSSNRFGSVGVMSGKRKQDQVSGDVEKQSDDAGLATKESKVPPIEDMRMKFRRSDTLQTHTDELWSPQETIPADSPSRQSVSAEPLSQ